jgi:hypothetical protein
MEYVRFFAELGVALMGAVAFPFLILTFLRSHKIPECYSCGAMKMRPSRIVGFWDSLGSAFLLRPYRCEGCRERFHAFLPFSGTRVQPQRIVKLAVRFRKGLPNRISIRVIHVTPESPSASPSALHTYAS